jgi:hypothetical protein
MINGWVMRKKTTDTSEGKNIERYSGKCLTEIGKQGGTEDSIPNPIRSYNEQMLHSGASIREEQLVGVPKPDHTTYTAVFHLSFYPAKCMENSKIH